MGFKALDIIYGTLNPKRLSALSRSLWLQGPWAPPPKLKASDGLRLKTEVIYRVSGFGLACQCFDPETRN